MTSTTPHDRDMAVLREHLDTFVLHATTVMPPRSECSITLRTGREDVRLSSSGPRAARCDDLEVAAGIGPCIDAVDTLRVTLTPDLDQETRWADWTGVVRELGFRSVGAFPIHVGDGARAAFNVYSEQPDPWDRDALLRCDVYAQQVATVVDLFLETSDLRRTRQELQRAVAAQAAIDQAIGAIMVAQACDAGTALQVLRARSREEGSGLTDAARRVLDALDRDARTRDV